MSIKWMPRAYVALENIYNFIAEDNSLIAAKWQVAIIKMIDQLETFPEMGRVVPEVRRSDTRELIYGNYRIVYRLKKDQVYILTIWHSKRLLTSSEIQ